MQTFIIIKKILLISTLPKIKGSIIKNYNRKINKLSISNIKNKKKLGE